MNCNKMIRSLLLLFAVWGVSVVVSAQNDPDATVKAIYEVLPKINPLSGADNLVEELCKKYKSNPKVLQGIGEAYYHAGDSAKAKKVFQLAIDSDPKYTPVYIAAGDWARDRYGREAYDEALQWYDKAISVDPKDSTAYMRCAKILIWQDRLDEAVEKMKTIVASSPNFPINLQIARIYSSAAKLSEAISYYEKENLDIMDASDLTDFATCCLMRSNNDLCAKVVKYGVEKFPERLPLSRNGLISNVNLKNYEDAVRYGERYIYCTDTTKIRINQQDVYCMALAYQGVKKSQKAIEMFEKTINAEDEEANQVRRDNAYQSMAQIYVDEGEWEKAYVTYQKCYEIRKAAGRPTANVLNLYARAYQLQADELNGEEKFECYRTANRLYETIADESPEFAALALFLAWQNCIRMDPQSETYLGRPYAERVYALLSDKEKQEPLENSEKGYMENVSRYLGAYYYLYMKDKKASLPYWRKVYEFNPSHQGARTVLGIK